MATFAVGHPDLLIINGLHDSFFTSFQTRFGVKNLTRICTAVVPSEIREIVSWSGKWYQRVKLYPCAGTIFAHTGTTDWLDQIHVPTFGWRTVAGVPRDPAPRFYYRHKTLENIRN